MKVELLQNSRLDICAGAVRTCWQSQEKSDSKDGVCGQADKDLIERVGNKFKHASTLEHLTYTFYISGVSRALLQELARHRMSSPSVKSTRYTLKELKEEERFMDSSSISDKFDDIEWATIDSLDRAKKYLVFTGITSVDISSIQALDNLRSILIDGVSNDKAKYCLPESYKTELTWSINARSLQNFISLRSSKAALWEIRDLAKEIFNSLPEDHKYLFDHCLSEIAE